MPQHEPTTRSPLRTLTAATPRLLVMSLCLSFLFACGGVDPFHPGPPIPNDADAAEQCQAACAHFAAMQCDGWQGHAGPDEVTGTSDDVTCERACVDVQRVVPINADCIVASRSCDEADACEVE